MDNMIKRWLRILELNGKLRRLEKALLRVLEQPISDKLKDKKIDLIIEEKVKVKQEIDSLKKHKWIF